MNFIDNLFFEFFITKGVLTTGIRYVYNLIKENDVKKNEWELTNFWN